MSYTNQPKNNSTFTNQSFGGSGLSFGDFTHTFGEDQGSFGNPVKFTNTTKNASPFTNQTKN